MRRACWAGIMVMRTDRRGRCRRSTPCHLGAQVSADGFWGRAASSPQPGALRSHDLDHIRRTKWSVKASSSQEYMAALGLKKEIPIDSTNTTGTAKPCTRWVLSASSSISEDTRRCSPAAYQEIDTKSRLATAAVAA